MDSREISNTKTVWIGFKEAKFFIRHFLKKDFGHVYVLMKDYYNWGLIDPRNKSLEVMLLPYRPEENVPFITKKEFGHSILEVVVEKKINKWPNLNPFYMINCVNIVKYVLGVRLFCFTPYGLYKKLSKMNKKKKYTAGILKVTEIILDEQGDSDDI